MKDKFLNNNYILHNVIIEMINSNKEEMKNI